MNAVSAPVDAAAASADRLRITEIFLSLQGEARDAGWPTVFVRLTGCPLRCQYCDTAYAFHGGQWRDIDDILAEVAGHGVRHVCVTGGEPRSQKRCIGLLQRLCDAGYAVSLETSGAIDISAVDPRVSRVLDIKTPGSLEAGRNRWENIELLTAHDQVKFVLCGRDDYEWAREVVAKHGLDRRCDVLFSPSTSDLAPPQQPDWFVPDRLPSQSKLRLHNLRWDNSERLTAHGQVKFVLCGRDDYEWARELVAKHGLDRRCDVLFSPSKSELAPRELADWIVADRLPVKFQMQLHKLLWDDEPGR